MKWVGITGSIGTGKSTVSEILRSKGYIVLDADRLAKEELAKGTEGYVQIKKTWGSAVLDSSQTIDKKKMADIVFKSPEQLGKLESILHPLVQKKIQELKKKYSSEGCDILFYDVPLLYEKNLQNQFDAVILVCAKPELQWERIKLRNNWSDLEIRNRLSSQLSLDEKKKFQNYIINNDYDLESLKKQIETVVSAILLEK